jgi:HSP20 family protein
MKMNLEKLKPWNWFKHEENGKGTQIPVSRSEAGNMPQAGPGSLMSLQRGGTGFPDEPAA